MTGAIMSAMMKSTLGSMDNRAANIVTFRDIERASVDYYAHYAYGLYGRRARLIEDTLSGPPNYRLLRMGQKCL